MLLWGVEVGHCASPQEFRVPYTFLDTVATILKERAFECLRSAAPPTTWGTIWGCYGGGGAGLGATPRRRE